MWLQERDHPVCHAPSTRSFIQNGIYPAPLPPNTPSASPSSKTYPFPSPSGGLLHLGAHCGLGPMSPVHRHRGRCCRTCSVAASQGLSHGLTQDCIRREGASEAAPEAVRQAVGGGCQSGWGGYCRLQMPLKPALGVRGRQPGRYLPPFQCIPGPQHTGGRGPHVRAGSVVWSPPPSSHTRAGHGWATNGTAASGGSGPASDWEGAVRVFD